jgi:hypothetical protein
LRLRDVQGNLGAESLGRVEAALGAQTMQEGQLQRGIFIERDGCEVQQMGLDSEGVRAEGGTVAGVGDAAKDVLSVRRRRCASLEM